MAKPKAWNRHGLAHTPIYWVWRSMLQRCGNPNFTQYKNYGGRGIRVCDRWKDIKNFIADMGERPPGSQIDRIDNNGNYEPGNCRWATRAEQASNRSDNRNLTYDGRTMSLSDWSRAMGISLELIRDRLDRGWAVDRALLTPAGKYRRPTEQILKLIEEAS